MSGADFSYRSETFTVAANDTLKRDAFGTFLQILDASGTGFSLSIDGAEEQFIEAGIGPRLVDEFNTVRFNNSTGAPITITWAWGHGDVVDNRLVVPAGIKLAKAKTLPTPADVTVATVSTAQLLVADTTRRRAHIGLDPGAPAACRVGGSGVGAAAGREIQPGGGITLEGEAAIHAHNPGAAGAKFTITTETD